MLAGLSAVDCSQSYAGNTGTITSYNFPFDYRHNLTCIYRVHVGTSTTQHSSHVICLTFHRFSLETSSPFCSFDYLQVGWNPAVKYCGRGLWQYGVADSTNHLSTIWSPNFCCKWFLWWMPVLYMMLNAADANITTAAAAAKILIK